MEWNGVAPNAIQFLILHLLLRSCRVKIVSVVYFFDCYVSALDRINLIDAALSMLTDEFGLAENGHWTDPTWIKSQQ